MLVVQIAITMAMCEMRMWHTAVGVSATQSDADIEQPNAYRETLSTSRGRGAIAGGTYYAARVAQRWRFAMLGCAGRMPAAGAVPAHVCNVHLKQWRSRVAMRMLRKSV